MSVTFSGVLLRSMYTPVLPERDTILFQLLTFIRLKTLTPDFLIKNHNQDFLMPTNRKQKKARKSRGAEMLSDVENLDIMLGGNPLERKESEYGNSSRRSMSLSLNTHENDEETHNLNYRENRSGNSAGNGHNYADTDSSAEFNKLLGELNLRISREMDEMINSVSVQIQRAINDAISSQVSPQIQKALKPGSGQSSQKGWNISTERTERQPEDHPSRKVRSSSKSEPVRNRLNEDNTDQAYDTHYLWAKSNNN